MTGDPDYPETPKGMAEDAKAFADWEDDFIARNRDAINKLLEEAHDDVRQGRVVKWNLEDALERNTRRYEEHLAKQRS